ncbi:hypothetical protein [Streptomyces sp. NPDC047990]|uniref:hypothetical protein n=1 Tax=Streptomyces sp. NPDC047990 TaxID=3365496 RepID=UPI00371C3650
MDDTRTAAAAVRDVTRDPAPNEVLPAPDPRVSRGGLDEPVGIARSPDASQHTAIARDFPADATTVANGAKAEESSSRPALVTADRADALHAQRRKAA